MYENNYNYIDVPEEKTKNSGGSAKKTVAMLLAVAIVGGASGFGGAYLQNTINSEKAIEVSESVSDKNKDSDKDNKAEENQISAVTTAASDDNSVSSLLNSSANNSGELTTQQIVEKVTPSVVSVHSQFESSSGTSSGTGTGIILSSDGYIITNAHVVQTEISEYVKNDNRMNPYGNDYGDIFSYFFGNGIGGGSYQTTLKNATSLTIVLSTDDQNEYEAEIIGVDTNSDLAVIKIDKDDLVPAEFGNSDDLTMGSTAIAIGYPLGLGLSTSQGIISGLNRTIDVELSGGGSASMTLIQTDAAINPGNSGGPLINGKGQVIGITSSKLVDSSLEGLGFAIPITDAMPLISDLMNKGYVSSPQIGITGTNVNSAVMRYYGLPVDEGVMVVSVNEGSGAEAAGICAGDVIIAANGEKITSMDELTAAKKGKNVGDIITVTLARAHGSEDVDIVLTDDESAKPEMESRDY
ncbi:MAG: S1C family serine protease [Huintestinicola sp.]